MSVNGADALVASAGIADDSGHISQSLVPSQVSISQKKSPFNYVSSTNAPNYASAMQMNQFPKKNQGFVCDYIEGLILENYFDAVSLVIPPEKIVAGFKSFNMVKIYLESKELTEKFVNDNPTLKIQEHEIRIKHLVVPNKKVILSNVDPGIPHWAIEEFIDKLNVRRFSSVTLFKTSTTNEKYKHITGSRRVVYVHFEDVNKIPPITRFTFDDETSIMFASPDILKCFVCKDEGHIARMCTKQTENSSSPVDNIMSDNTTNEKINESCELSQELLDSRKRGHSELSSDTISTADTNEIENPETQLTTSMQHSETENKNSAGAAKKQRNNSRSPVRNLDTLLEPIKKILDEENSLLNYFEFKNFLECIQGSKDPLNIASSYCQDIDDLIKFMRKLYVKLDNPAIKNRFTRTINTLNNVKSLSKPNNTKIINSNRNTDSNNKNGQ